MGLSWLNVSGANSDGSWDGEFGRASSLGNTGGLGQSNGHPSFVLASGELRQWSFRKKESLDFNGAMEEEDLPW